MEFRIKIKNNVKIGLTFFLMMWISANYAQKSNIEKKTSTPAEKQNKEKLLAIEKACQTIIDKKYDNHLVAGDTAVSSSDINLLKVLGNIGSELRNHGNAKNETTEAKTQSDTAKTLNDFYSKDKYAALISHGKEFIKKTELLSQTLHQKGDGFEAALKMNKLEDQNALLTKMGQVFHTLASRLDASIMDLRKTQPYLEEVYTKLLAVENGGLEVSKKLSLSIEATKSLYGVVLYMTAIKNCNATVSEIQDDLAFLAKAARSEKVN